MKTLIPERNMILPVFCLIILGCFQNADTCQFPSNLQGDWTSTEFGDITINGTHAEFVDVNEVTSSFWECHAESENKFYVIKSLDETTSASLGTQVFFYYCFEFIQQSTNSYLYYHPTDPSNGIRRLQLGSDTVSVSFACSGSIDKAEYHVMVRSASANSVKNVCVSPLLGNFQYACASMSTDNGTLNVCDISSQTTLTFNHSQCTGNVIYSADGVLNCVAKTSGTVSSQTVYYQTLYNNDAAVDGLTTRRFVCLAVTEESDGTIIFSYSPSTCVSQQTSTTSTGVVLTFEQLDPTTLCPITTESNKNNTALIVGLVIGFLILIIIIGALIFYFCFYKKDPNAGKPIVENTKPRFEDPDKEDIIEDLELVDTRSTPVTRDEITFEALSPTLVTNGKIPNGNPVSMSPIGAVSGGFCPSAMGNGSLRRDSGIASTEKSSERPTPRIGINLNKESMVIFNGDEKVISGNDTRIVPNENPSTRTFRMNNSMSGGGGPLTLEGLDNEEDDELGELSPHRENMPYPSLPREKSNLMPPIETIDPEKDKET